MFLMSKSRSLRLAHLLVVESALCTSWDGGAWTVQKFSSQGLFFLLSYRIWGHAYRLSARDGPVFHLVASSEPTSMDDGGVVMRLKADRLTSFYQCSLLNFHNPRSITLAPLLLSASPISHSRRISSFDLAKRSAFLLPTRRLPCIEPTCWFCSPTGKPPIPPFGSFPLTKKPQPWRPAQAGLTTTPSRSSSTICADCKTFLLRQLHSKLTQ